jgi:hypothetical protein
MSMTSLGQRADIEQPVFHFGSATLDEPLATPDPALRKLRMSAMLDDEDNQVDPARAYF